MPPSNPDPDSPVGGQRALAEGLDRAEKLLRRHAVTLLSCKDVVSCGVDLERVAETADRRAVIIVTVRETSPQFGLGTVEEASLPDEIDGIPVRVRIENQPAVRAEEQAVVE